MPHRILFTLAAAALLLTAASQSRAQDVNFEDQIFPILNNNCFKCHGTETQKADLSFQSPETFAEHDTLLSTDDPEFSDLIFRITLPADDADVMPPEGEGDHLTDEQINLIRTWMSQGASFGEWKGLESAPLGPQLPIVPPAPDTALKALRDAGALAMPLAQNTNLLTVDFRAEATNITDDNLKLLQPVAQQVAWLNLANTQVTDAGLAQLAALPNLMRLHLENTQVADAGIAHLAKLNHLEYLNLYGTNVSDIGLIHLSNLPKLAKVYVWQTKVTDPAAAAFFQARGTQVNTGFKPAPEQPQTEEKPEPDKAAALPIKDIMTKAHEDGLLKKILEGGATDAEKQQLVNFYQTLAAHSAPQGDADHWKNLTTTLLAAAQSTATDASPANIEALKSASNCKACHSQHKP